MFGILRVMRDLEKFTAKRFVSPKRVITEFSLWEGDHVADFGVGAGHFIPHLLQGVGDTGHVYLISGEELRLRMVLRDAIGAGTTKCSAISYANTTEIPLEDGVLDGIIVHAYHDTPEVLFTHATRLIRRGGKLAFLDWKDDASLCVSKRPSYTRKLLDSLAERFGFAPKREFTTDAVGDMHYGILYTRL